MEGCGEEHTGPDRRDEDGHGRGMTGRGYGNVYHGDLGGGYGRGGRGRHGARFPVSSASSSPLQFLYVSVPRGAWWTLQVLSRLRAKGSRVPERGVRGLGYGLIELGLRVFYSCFLWVIAVPGNIVIKQVMSEGQLHGPGILRGWRRLCLDPCSGRRDKNGGGIPMVEYGK